LLMEQLSRVGYSPNTTNIDDVNAMLSLVHNIKPNDDLEALIVSQMVVTHMLSMNNANGAIHLGDEKIKTAKHEMAIKLMRSFTNQFNALSKHRNGGKQKMTVEHVHVNEGGQAIIGDVSKG